MAVKFEIRENPGLAITGVGIAPFWICDTCGEKIEGTGNAIFVTEANGEHTGEFLTIHKDRCETDETRRYPWQDLDMFMWELFNNAGFDWGEVERRRAQLREDGLNT